MRRLKQFDGFTWLTHTHPLFYDRSTPLCVRAKTAELTDRTWFSVGRRTGWSRRSGLDRAGRCSASPGTWTSNCSPENLLDKQYIIKQYTLPCVSCVWTLCNETMLTVSAWIFLHPITLLTPSRFWIEGHVIFRTDSCTQNNTPRTQRGCRPNNVMYNKSRLHCNVYGSTKVRLHAITQLKICEQMR